MRILPAISLLLLGLARGLGGVALVANGAGVDTGITGTPAAVRFSGLTLCVVAGLAIVAGAGVWTRRRWGAWLGIVTSVLFFVDGLLTGTLLYGAPRASGTVVNAIIALGLVALLFLGRGARSGSR